MNRRTSYLQNELERLSNELQLVFSDVGFSYAEKEEKERLHFQKLVEALQIRLLEEKAYRDELKQRCVKKQDRLKVLKTTTLPDVVVGAAGTAGLVAVIDEPVNPPYKKFLERLERFGNKLEQVFEERSERVRQIQLELDRLDELMGLESDSGYEGWRVELDGPALPRLTLDVITAAEHQLKQRQMEYESRQQQVEQLAVAITEHWSILGVDNSELDETIIQHRAVPLELTASKITYLQDTLKELQSVRAERQRAIETYRAEVEHLWSRLDENEEIINNFLSTVAGETTTVVERWGEELERMRQQKQAHLDVFIAEARDNLKSIWDALFYSEEQRQAFVPFYMTDDSSEALLEVHEKEILAREADLNENESLLELVKQHKRLLQDAKELEESSRDPSRLMGKSQRGDPGRLLREEQTRKQISRRMPTVVASLKNALSRYEEERGVPFLVYGKPYLEEILHQEVVSQTPRRRAAGNSVCGTPYSSVSRSTTRSAGTRSLQSSPTKTRHPKSVPPTSSNNSIQANLKALRNPNGNSTISGDITRSAIVTPSSRTARSVPRQPLQNSTNRINKASSVPRLKRRSVAKKLTAAQVSHNLMGGGVTPVREAAADRPWYPQSIQRIPTQSSSPRKLPSSFSAAPTPKLLVADCPIRSPIPVLENPPSFVTSAASAPSKPVYTGLSSKSPSGTHGQRGRFYTGGVESNIRSVSGTSTISTASSTSIFSDVCELQSSDEEDPEYAALMLQQRRQISQGLPETRSDQPRLSEFNWDKDVF